MFRIKSKICSYVKLKLDCLCHELLEHNSFFFLILQVANMRHNALFRRFITALTRGGPGGMPRPIEVHAHDPLRYVGDMLGWLHQVCHESLMDVCFS
jgi:hypothetical protein